MAKVRRTKKGKRVSPVRRRHMRRMRIIRSPEVRRFYHWEDGFRFAWEAVIKGDPTGDPHVLARRAAALAEAYTDVYREHRPKSLDE
jgi:hypothetical protein